MEENKKINLEELFKNLGLEDLPEERKANFLSQIGQLLVRRVLIRIVDRLNDNQQDELEDILEKNNQEEVLQFLEKNIPDLEEIIKEEAEFIREDILSILKNYPKD